MTLENYEVFSTEALESRDAGASGSHLIGVGEIPGLVEAPGAVLHEVLRAVERRLGVAVTRVHKVGSEPAMLALGADPGDLAVRSDLSRTFALARFPASLAENWAELPAPSSAPTPPPDDSPQTVQNLSGASNISVTKALVPVSSSAHLTLTSTPVIAAATDGRRVRLLNVGARNITLPSEDLRPGSGLNLASYSLTLEPGSALDLTYSSALAAWTQAGASPGDLARLGPVVLREDFDGVSLDAGLWTTADRLFGRGALRSLNAGVANGRLVLKTPAGTFDGAEIKSALPIHGYGSYSSRIKACPAEGSLTNLFLYVGPDGYSELDIEIFGGPLRRIDFTSYSGPGAASTLQNTTHQVRSVLMPFDPAADFHDYRIDYHPEHLSFWVDGELYHQINRAIPQGLMHLFVNLWWPTWVDAPAPPATEVRAEYEFLEKRALPDSAARPHGPTHGQGGHDWLDPRQIGAQRAGMRDNPVEQNYTLDLSTDAHTQHFTAPALTAQRHVVLARPPARLAQTYKGQRFHVIRWSGNTGGPWNLTVWDNAVGAANLRALAQEQWAVFEWNGTAWGIVAAGNLYG